MRIIEVLLPCRDIAAARAFYEEFGCDVVPDGGRIRVAMGSSVLVFAPAEFDGDLHLAFTVPTGSFSQAKQWAGDHASLLSSDGTDEFEAAPTWNASSVYFDGPDGQVLELIERRDLDNRIDHGFTAADLCCVSEVGVAVPDVPTAVETLAATRVGFYGNPPGPGFAAVGDADGMLILVTPGRPWAPTRDRAAAEAPVHIHADVDTAVQLTPTTLLTR
jgi:catechol 2,3-dioxygenase-like lactoylglutathione lyase family enzyme